MHTAQVVSSQQHNEAGATPFGRRAQASSGSPETSNAASTVSSNAIVGSPSALSPTTSSPIANSDLPSAVRASSTRHAARRPSQTASSDATSRAGPNRISIETSGVRSRTTSSPSGWDWNPTKYGTTTTAAIATGIASAGSSATTFAELPSRRQASPTIASP